MRHNASSSPEAAGTWVSCWASIPDDAVPSEAGHTVVPGGRWLVDMLVPYLEKHGARVAGIGFEYSGYWWMHVDQGDRRFRLFVYFMGGVGNLRIERRRGLLGWLSRRDYSAEVRELAESLVQGLQGDQRVQRATISSSYVEG